MSKAIEVKRWRGFKLKNSLNKYPIPIKKESVTIKVKEDES